MLLSLFSAAAAAAASVSGAILSHSVPVIGSAIVKGAGAVGTAVGSAVTGASGSTLAGGIAANTTRTAIHSASIKAASDFSD
ncbi:MAG: hypothetical protein IKN62_02865 [Elusimicrobia bacterium]|nr:hypothetical protein [Elusimicrobiota bacterium]